MARAEVKQRIPFIILDTDFFDKPENVEAIDRFSDLAPAAILRLCLKLMNEENASMKKSQVLAMWRASGTAQNVWAEIIEYYLSCGWLIEENQCITSARVNKERTRVLQKRETLSANAKQKLSKSKAKPKQKRSILTDTDTDTLTDSDLNKTNNSKAKTQFGEYVFLTDSEIQKFKGDLGDQAFERCCEKLNAWIGSNPDIGRRRNGKNAAYSFRNWVINSVAEEQAKAGKIRNLQTNQQIPKSILETRAKFEAIDNQ